MGYCNYKMECKIAGFQGKIYGWTGVRYGDWNHKKWMKLHIFGYASLDTVLMMEFGLCTDQPLITQLDPKANDGNTD